MKRVPAVNRAPSILCVDDDQSILDIAKLALEFEGYSVLTANSGPAALEKFVEGPVDAVVLDYDMPGMNGGQVAHEMKRLNPSVPKLLFTSHTQVPGQAATSIEAFCTKMSGIRALVSGVHEMLEMHA